MKRHSLIVLAFLAMVSIPASAQTGVSEERVSLPEGPGSLEGVGEAVSVNPNMGQLNYGVPIVVPAGFPGLTPDVSLSYSSGMGSGVVGVGWNITFPAIERLTLRGLPEYDTDDEFAVNSSEQLVKVSGTSPITYRSRMEKSFVRYRWHGAGDGKEGYWTAEYPDGRIGYFGADHTGQIVADSRVGTATGTFRYHLTEMTDRYGHWIRYTYKHFGNVALPLHIGWVYVDDSARYEVTFAYEERTDRISDCKAGFNELLDQRVTKINVRAKGQTIRKYTMAYEDMAVSGGFSRLSSVTMTGLQGGIYPIVQSFEYSKALGAECKDAIDCTKPYVVNISGKLGVSLSQGHTTLIDINGDAVPDILDTTQLGKHRFFKSTIAKDGSQSFVTEESAVGTQGAYDIALKTTQVLDINGDGYVDILNASAGSALLNKGIGDWDTTPVALWGSGADGGLPTDFEPAAGELKSVRFMDFDNDRRIDVVRSQGADVDNNTALYRGTGVGAYALLEGAESIGAGFDSNNLELNDMNGDGLLDPVQLMNDILRYRLNYGRGKWAPWATIGGFNFTDAEKVDAELEDLNGDGLADIVLVTGGTVKYWLNRNGASFDVDKSISSKDVEGSIPIKEAGISVLFADMNGNGSSDVVWIDNAGAVTYLELFPVRPNLVSRISNSIGKNVSITYGSSVMHAVADGGWKYPLPHPMTVVDAVDEWDDLTGLHIETFYAYHDGYYDGKEKQFRGYERVEITIPGDDSQEDGMVAQVYDVGSGDPYRAGLQLSQETWAGGLVLDTNLSTFEDCKVAGIPDAGLLFDVRHVCKTHDTSEVREGTTDESQWATIESATEYDGYGNVSLQADLGVTKIGGAACSACDAAAYTGEPCGAQCLGDERYTATEYAEPEDNDDTWILNKAVRTRGYGVAKADGTPANASVTETTTYYDGEAFKGLDFGKIEKGTPIRTTTRLNAEGDVITTLRAKVDVHGNVIEQITANGSLADADDHRRRWVYDEDGLRILTSEILLTNAQGPYVLQRSYTWDPLWEQPTQATQWRVAGVGTDPGTYHYSYDEFGRVVTLTRPDASKEKPSEVYSYDLGWPASQIVIQRRSTTTGPLDLEEVECIDGHGRQYQTRKKIAEGSWQVTGFTIFGKQSEDREVYDAYLSNSKVCDTALPFGTSSVKRHYDGTGRPDAMFPPKPDANSPQPETRTVFLPLADESWDMEDTRKGGAHEGTPTTTRKNGLGQTLAIERVLKLGGAPIIHRLEYDELGRIARVIDPAGITTSYERDLAGRITELSDPDRGTSTFEYDANGNNTREVDGDGRVIVRQYDALNRLTAQWEEDNEAATKQTLAYDIRPADCAADECSNAPSHLVSARYPLGDGTFGEDRFGYDPHSKPIWTSRTLHGHEFVTTSTYDHAGRLLSQTHPNGLDVPAEYDGLSRVIAVPGFIKAVGYDDEGLQASVALQNGVTTEVVRDELGRITGLIGSGKPATPITAYTLTYDLVGNLLSVQDDRADDGQPMGGANYTFDALYRMTAAHLDPTRPAFAEKLAVSIDASERVTSMTSDKGAASKVHVGSLTYGASDFPRAVTKAGDLTYAYDGAGRLVQRGKTTYEWDHLGRMTRASADGKELARFGYGTGTSRVLKQEGDDTTLYVSEGFEIRDGTAVTSIQVGRKRYVRVEQPAFAAEFYSDVAPATGADMALTPSPDGLISSGDAWLSQATGAGLLKLSEDVQMDPSSIDDLLDASNRRLLHGIEEKVTYEHHDFLGSSVAETDAGGALTGRTERYPTGTLRHSSGPESTRGFTGQERDESTGLVYVGARYLDPWIGRWTAPDPGFRVFNSGMVARFAEATCNYAYVVNNPVTKHDPTGEGGEDGNDVSTPGGQDDAVMMSIVEQEQINNVQAVTTFVPHINESAAYTTPDGSLSGGDQKGIDSQPNESDVTIVIKSSKESKSDVIPKATVTVPQTRSKAAVLVSVDGRPHAPRPPVKLTSKWVKLGAKSNFLRGIFRKVGASRYLKASHKLRAEKQANAQIDAKMGPASPKQEKNDGKGTMKDIMGSHSYVPSDAKAQSKLTEKK